MGEQREEGKNEKEDGRGKKKPPQVADKSKAEP
jgi:hypothetical protein